MNAPTRPVLRYHGGKFRLAEWIISHFPPHGMYVEPFSGAASILMQKPRVQGECLNDLDERVVNVFRVLRDPVKSEALRQKLELTPFARAEFEDAYTPPCDDVDSAHKCIVLSFMGHGSDSIGRGYRTGFRCKHSDGRSLPSAEWAEYPQQIRLFRERLRGVAIERRPAIEVIQRLDSPTTLFYADPPYLTSVRTASVGKHGYRHEMTDEEHCELADVLRRVEGMVVLSGYTSELYDELYQDWQRRECETLADGARPRTEVLWLNPACAARQSQTRLFA